MSLVATRARLEVSAFATASSKFSCATCVSAMNRFLRAP